MKKVTIFQTHNGTEFTGKFYSMKPIGKIPATLKGESVCMAQELELDPSGRGSFADEEALKSAGYVFADENN